MMTQKEIAKQNDADLVKLISEKRQALQALRFGKAERNTNKTREIKTEIALALSELNQRSRQSAKTS